MSDEPPIVVAAPPMPFFDMAKAHLSSPNVENRIPYAYQDSLGFWTIGVGRLIDRRKGGHLRDDEIDYLLANDIKECVAGMQGWPAWDAVKDDNVRATALISMAFQMGVQGLAGFSHSLALIADRQWQAAADALLQSLWAKQTPNRAKLVTQMIVTGELP